MGGRLGVRGGVGGCDGGVGSEVPLTPHTGFLRLENTWVMKSSRHI